MIPPHLCGRLSPRSGLARKGIVGQIGTLDSDYRGPITAILLNHTSAPYKIEAGERVIQLVLLRIAIPEPREIMLLPPTLRGAGGFGSTGRKEILMPQCGHKRHLEIGESSSDPHSNKENVDPSLPLEF